jgi:predicted Zn-dependent peptidase
MFTKNEIHISQLPNGLTIITAENRDAESVSGGIWIKAGGRYEAASESGYSHFLEHMLFKGTSTRSPVDLSSQIEGRGGYLNAYTQEESTCYYFRLPSEFATEGIDVLADMYRNSLLSERELSREREVVLEEIKMYQDLPHHLVQEKLQEAMFRDHAIGRPLAGNATTLAELDHERLRIFKESCYQPGCTVMALAGRVDHAECVTQAARHLGDLPPGTGRVLVPVETTHEQHSLTVSVRDLGQVHAVAGFRLFGRHDQRRYALRVLNGLLGENMSSRLFQSVREQHGLCYSIQSGYQLFADCGVFSISGGFDESRAYAALELTASELRSLLDKGVTSDELERTKQYLQGTFRLGLESTSSRMTYLGESYVNYGDIREPREVLEGIRAVGIEDVNQLAVEILSEDNMTLAVVASEKLCYDQQRWLDAMRF